MIKFITGVPGSGKTFYLVKFLRDEYFKIREDGTFEAKTDCTIFANIDGLKLDHQDLDSCVKAAGGISKFFNVPFFEKLIKKYPRPVIVIDECQRYFDFKFSDRAVLYLFEYHRHLGVDFIMASQSINLISRGLRDLGEVEIRGLRRSLSLFGEFKYKHLVGNEIFRYETLKRDKGVFSLYTSMVAKERGKISKPMLKYLAAIVVIFVLGVILSIYAFGFWGDRDKRNAASKKDPSSKSSSIRDPQLSSSASSIPVSDLLKYWVPCDFACVGSSVFVIRYGELMNVNTVPGRFQVFRKGDVVIDVREELTGLELRKREESRNEARKAAQDMNARTNREGVSSPLVDENSMIKSTLSSVKLNTLSGKKATP